jgi:hypothetical protein
MTEDAWDPDEIVIMLFFIFLALVGLFLFLCSLKALGILPDSILGWRFINGTFIHG